MAQNLNQIEIRIEYESTTIVYSIEIKESVIFWKCTMLKRCMIDPNNKEIEHLAKCTEQ
jgi:hypothetical protein